MTTTKKTHWRRTTILVLLACGIAGTVWAAIAFNANPGRTCASASLQFSFGSAGEGIGPNGEPFNVNGIYEDEVIGEALKASSLDTAYTVDQIRDNLTVTAVYPEDIVNRMTAYTSLLDADADMQAAVTDYHPTVFSVSLYHDFDPGISSDSLTGLLKNLLDAYRTHFAKNNSPGLEQTEVLPDLQEYDYAQQLTAITEASAQQSRYASEMAEKAPDFQSNRKSFTDILTAYETLDSDIARLNAAVSLNALSKDRERLKNQYEMEVRDLTRKTEGIKEEQKLIDDLLKTYDKDGILYVSTSSALRQVDSNTSETYDKLVKRKQELAEQLSDANAQIANYESLLADMTAEETTAAATTKDETAEAAEGEAEESASAPELTEAEREALNEKTERQLANLREKQSKVTGQFTNMLDAYTDSQVNENTVSVRGLRYAAPSMFNFSFILRIIRTAGPLCAVGFMVCLILLIVSRARQGKAKKA